MKKSSAKRFSQGRFHFDSRIYGGKAVSRFDFPSVVWMLLSEFATVGNTCGSAILQELPGSRKRVDGFFATMSDTCGLRAPGNSWSAWAQGGAVARGDEG